MSRAPKYFNPNSDSDRMLLRQVSLHNFAGYRGRHVIDLAPPANERPVILFGGLNGAGKTSLLDALQLVLYGKRARCSGRGNLPYEEYLRRSIHRGVPEGEGAAIELLIDAAFDGATSTFRLHRSWEPSATGVREHLAVMRDDRSAESIAERWDEFVEELLPLDISSLFFFDGEKIESLADPERAGRVVATAVESLLGLNLLDRLKMDLIALERRQRSASTASGVRDLFAVLEQGVAQARDARAEALQEQASRRNAVDRAEADLARARQRLTNEGGELYDRRSEIEETRHAAAERLRRIDEEIRDHAAGSLPLRLVGPLLERLLEQVRRESEATRAEILQEELSERDRNLLDQLQDIPTDLLDRVRSVLDADRTTRAASALTPRYLHATIELEQRLAFLWPNELGRSADVLSDLLAARDAAETDLEYCERRLAAVPTADAISDALVERDRLITALTEKHVLLTIATEAVAAAEKSVSDAEAKLDRAYRDSSEAAAIEEHTRRIIDHADRVRRMLSGFRAALLERHLNRIEAAVLDSLRKMLRKQRLVADLRIDPETFELALFDDQGRTVPTERLSAGERQILAVAVLWGLARVSGRRLPMVIDTPLGRLDSTHRQLIVERYFPNASHQVILLSTDQEIDEGLLDSLEPAVGRTYELRHNDEQQCTQVSEGYFWTVATDVA